MTRHRVLVVHNAYQHAGGEDTVVEAEVALLRSHGHEVDQWTRSNQEVVGMPSSELARETLWSGRTERELARRVAGFRPDVIHVHNTFPLISPSLYWAAERAGVPVVQTLHNFRLMCLNALFLRDGQICEDCMGQVPWRGLVRKCYRQSYSASAALAAMLVLHRGLGTYRNKVARYIALNAFCRDKFVEAGLPAERVAIKPNFVDYAAPEPKPRAGLLFVGRLSVEKGIATLVGAKKKLPGAQLRIAGDGPEAGLLDGLGSTTRLGSLPNPVIREEMAGAIALIVPSIWYENFPRTIVEAFACGLPVIASRIGALAEIVKDGDTGLLFEPGDPVDLADRMAWALAHPDEMSRMGQNARAQYEAEFSAEVNYQCLSDIYSGVITPE